MRGGAGGVALVGAALVVAAFLLAPASTASVSHRPLLLVNTTLGSVQGKLGDACREFLGVPFAAKPVGNLRFRPAQAAQAWSPRVWNATAFAPACTQSGRLGSRSNEDCLYLNIFAPLTTPSLLPVMFWIHGGGYMTGSGFEFNGTRLAHEGVVVVTINYRLGAFGQLSSEELRDENPLFASLGGMNFVADQIAALQWVRDEIAAFGGDKDQITIFGESAGSVSVCCIGASPLARGMFRNAILQSGACIEGWGPTQAHVGLEASQQFMRELNVSTLRELRALAPSQMLEAATYTAVRPAVDGFVLPVHPNVTYATPQNTSFPPDCRVLVGATSQDGLMPEPFFAFGHDLPSTPSEFDGALRLYFGDLAPLDDGTSVVEAITRAYPPTPNATQSYIQINSDLCVACGARKLALLLGATGRQAFAYSFGFNPGNHGLASHSSDNGLVFGYPSSSFPFDEALSAGMREAWARLAKGAPVVAADTEWLPFADGRERFLNVSSSGFAMLEDFRTDRCALWAQVGRFGWEGGGQAMLEFCRQTLGTHQPHNRAEQQATVVGVNGWNVGLWQQKK